MPARSKSQQRLFGWIHAVQKGEAKSAPWKIKSLARRVDPEDVKHFAETRHSRLPERKVEKDAAYIRGFIDTLTKAAEPKYRAMCMPGNTNGLSFSQLPRIDQDRIFRAWFPKWYSFLNPMNYLGIRRLRFVDENSGR